MSLIVAIISALLGIAGFIAIIVCVTGVLREGRIEREKWRRLALTLKCPKCGAAYDKWDGGTWGIDSYPPGPLETEGKVLTCPQCRADGYALERADTVQVFDSLEELEG
ncbi:MAG: hypothetical protein K8T91_22205 [Planctomycetes bacterium]|nr:hypothetical protein [Planctomycetota bacterium]